MEGQVQPVKATDWGWVGRSGVRNSLRPILLTSLAAAFTKAAMSAARWRGYRVVAIDSPLLAGTALISLGFFLRETRKSYQFPHSEKFGQIRSNWGEAVELNIARWMACPAARDRDQLAVQWYGLEGISYHEMTMAVSFFMEELEISDWKEIQISTNNLLNWFGFIPHKDGTLPGDLFPIVEAIIEAVGFQEDLLDTDRVKERLDATEWRGVDPNWVREALTFLKGGQWGSLDDSISKWIESKESSLDRELVIEYYRTEYQLTPEKDRDRCALKIARSLGTLVSKEELVTTLSEKEGNIKFVSQKQMEEIVGIKVEETDETFGIPVCVTAARLREISEEAEEALKREQIVEAFQSEYGDLSDRLLDDAFALLDRRVDLEVPEQ